VDRGGFVAHVHQIETGIERARRAIAIGDAKQKLEDYAAYSNACKKG